jgi:AcrR family transcriptional regulator
VLDAAFETFIELGYEAASVAEIARRAGCSKQTIYSRFPTKADLFKAVIRRGTDSFHQIFSEILVPDQAVEKVLYKYGENLAHVLQQPDAQKFFRTVIAASKSFPEMAEFFWEHGSQQGKKHLAEYLRLQASAGILNIEHPILAAQMFESLCLGPGLVMTTMGLQLPDSPAQMRRHVQEAVRIFLAAYGRTAAPIVANRKIREHTRR